MAAHILYLYAQPYRAGSLHARQTVQMLMLLRAQGFNVDLLTLPGGDLWPTGLFDKRYVTPKIPFVKTLPLYGNGFSRLMATTYLIGITLRLFFYEKYDVIHCADRSIRIGRLVAWLFGAKFVFEWRSSSGHDLIRWLQRRSHRFIRSISLIISDVSYTFNQLKATRLSGRICYIPLLPSPLILKQNWPSPRLSGNTDIFRVVAFSRTADLSDLTSLFNAMHAIYKQAPCVRFTIVGGDAQFCDQHRQDIETRFSKGDAFVEVVGPLHDTQHLNTLFERASLIFLPAEIRTQPPAILLDAMVSHRAIMAINSPAYLSLLGNHAGFLVRPKTIASSILECIQTPFLTLTYAQQAADTIDHERNPSSTAATLRSCYLFALAERPQ